jgi:hypothetical protein
VDEVLENSEVGQFEFSKKVIVPAVYHVFLHPDDLERLEPVVPVIEEECKDGLNRRLERLNRKRFGRKQRYGIQARDWEVRVFANHEPGAEPSSVKVVSRLAPSQDREFVGAVTVRVKRPTDKTTGKTPTHPPEAFDGGATKKTREASPPWGTLTYKDDGGEKVFPLTGDATSIGRGSSMDLVIRNSSEDVSRRHCRIRRDADGQVLISDLKSSNGTSLNGAALPPNIETPLTDQSEIALANGVVVLKFDRRRA